MRIVFWNIRAGGGCRTDGIATQLERWNPDVVALCEFRATPPSAELARRLADRGLAYQRTTADPRRPGVNALLIAARWPLRRIRLASEPLEPGRWLLARIDASTPFLLGAMHVPNRGTGRKYVFHDAVLALVKGWRRGPALLVGDTNSGYPGIDEETAVFGPQEERWLKSLEGLGWADGFRLIRANDRAFTWYSPNGRNGFRLDQAFINRALSQRLRDARYEWGRRSPARLSDHAALLLDFERSASGARAGRRLASSV